MKLSLEGLSHDYGGLTVLENIDLAVEEGEIVCIVGPSGCGKSTLLRLIGGLEQPSEGRVLQEGIPPAGSLNPLTYVFQDFALLPWRTAAGNIALVLEDHDMGAATRDEIVAEALRRTNLTDFAGAFPRQLSGGMKQRVAIAHALAVKPAIMLMDEPLSALDAQTRDLLIEDLVALWTRAPFGAVYVTHNLAEAVRLGHRIAVLSRRPGRIRALVEIERPLAERRAGQPDLEAKAAELWSLLRDEAKAADQELVGA